MCIIHITLLLNKVFYTLIKVCCVYLDTNYRDAALLRAVIYQPQDSSTKDRKGGLYSYGSGLGREVWLSIRLRCTVHIV
jgi:hypothetical protein